MEVKMDFLNLLEHSYEENKANRGDQALERLEFLADDIFDFTTYENTVSSMMAQKAIEVCMAINDKKTFDYISNEQGNLWYLIMVNMPFFQNKLEWGTSIRGAWWDLYGDKTFVIESCGLFEDGEQLLEMRLNEKQWGEFIEAMIKFIAK